jgi:ornithine--oxo-acid transaminase
LCRAGRKFVCEYEGVLPDGYVIGKSLGGGIVPISAFVAKREILDLMQPGSHGSTFGGSSFACAIAREVLAVIRDEKPDERSATLGEFFLDSLRALNSQHVSEIRGRGLFIGVDIRPSSGHPKEFCHRLKDRGILCKDTRGITIRFSPPLIIEKHDLEWAVEQISDILTM